MVMTDSALLILWVVLGAVFGSFATMLIYRLPIICTDANSEFGLCFPRSHCTHCQKTLAWWQLVPLVSFVFLRGKCGHCGQLIDWRYLWVELIFVATPVVAFAFFGTQLVAVTLFAWWLIVLSAIDAKHRILPDQVTLSGLWLGLVFSASTLGLTTANQAIYGAMFGYLFPYSINFLFSQIRGKQGMGYGDFKLFAMVGAWLGVVDLLSVFMLSSLLAIFYVLVRVLVRRIPISQAVAFGGFIACASLLIVVLRNQQLNLQNWLL